MNDDRTLFQHTKNYFSHYSDIRRRQGACTDTLRRVLFSLEELEVLKKEYNLRIPFNEYFNVRDTIVMVSS